MNNAEVNLTHDPQNIREMVISMIRDGLLAILAYLCYQAQDVASVALPNSASIVAVEVYTWTLRILSLVSILLIVYVNYHKALEIKKSRKTARKK